MRTEVKIGVAVGLLVAAIAVAYFLINNRNQPKPPDVANTEPERNKVLPPTPPADSGAPSLPPSPGAIPTAPPAGAVSSSIAPPPTTLPSIEVVSTPTTQPLRVEPVAPVGVTVVRPGDPVAPVAAPEADRTHTVAAGESLWSIAVKEYGDGNKWTNIVAANPGLTKNSVLRVGQKLKVPNAKAPATPVPGSGVAGVVPPAVDVPVAGAGSTQYTVQDGDAGLWAVAVKVYKDGNLWPAIQKANKDVKPSQLRKGQKLVIPSIEDARKMLNMTSSSGGTASTRSTGRTSSGAATSSGGSPRPTFD